MIYTLTLNPAIDYDLYLDSFNEGGLNQAKTTHLRAGGKGINVSKVLEKLGVPSTALGFVGGFTGDFICADLAKTGIKNQFISLSDNTRINIKINRAGIESEIAGLSPQITTEQLETLLNTLANLQSNDILVMSGSIPASIASNIYKTIASSLNSGVKTVLDTRGDRLEENLYHNLLIKPNISELESMFQKKFNSITEIKSSCHFYLEQGVENIIVSMGKEGALFVSESETFRAKAPEGKLINSVGAGDSMVAGFITGLQRGYNKRDSFSLAVAAGSATAYSQGLCDQTMVDKLFNQIDAVEI